jgi:hypothetical protein
MSLRPSPAAPLDLSVERAPLAQAMCNASAAVRLAHGARRGDRRAAEAAGVAALGGKAVLRTSEYDAEAIDDSLVAARNAASSAPGSGEARSPSSRSDGTVCILSVNADLMS